MWRRLRGKKRFGGENEEETWSRVRGQNMEEVEGEEDIWGKEDE